MSQAAESAWGRFGSDKPQRPSQDVEYTSFRLSMERQVPCPPWKLPLALASTLGCDSSDCLYCQGMAERRSLDGSKQVCWLRRKRSENELAALTNSDQTGIPPMHNASSTSCGRDSSSSSLNLNSEDNRMVPQEDSRDLPSFLCSSIWDHALLEHGEALEIIDSRIGTCRLPGLADAPWSLDPLYPCLPAPIPSQLVEIGHFAPPLTSRGPRYASDIACSIEFEEHGWLLATAGVSKQVLLYSLASCLSDATTAGDGDDGSMMNNNNQESEQSLSCKPLRKHHMASKLSSLVWDPDHPGLITLGDYDGGVTQVDLESGHVMGETDEHAGRRVWSVSHSLVRPHLMASGADDGTVVLWSGSSGLGQVQVAAKLATAAPVTGVHFSPYNENLLAVASADCSAYVYDLRKLNNNNNNAPTPLAALRGHERPLSYVKFLDPGRVVTAAVDGTIRSWDLATAVASSNATSNATGGFHGLERRFSGHCNKKNFVGLSVRPEDELIACGSEGPVVYAYNMAWSEPLVAHELIRHKRPAGTDHHHGDRQVTATSEAVPFCSAVAWQPATAAPGCGPVLAAATSDGSVRVLALRQSQTVHLPE